jgi:flagellar biosynthesis chaperone FliJ
MKSFRFTLEPILTIREREEEKALENYSAKLRAKTQAELRVYHTEQQLQSLRAEYHARHREATVRHEQKLIDDLVTSRAGRAAAA